ARAARGVTRAVPATRRPPDSRMGPSNYGIQTPQGMSIRSGAGRLKPHFPIDFVTPWAWTNTEVTVHQGDLLIFPIADGNPIPDWVTHWKFGALWTPPDLSAVPDVDFYIFDVTSGTGGYLPLAWDQSYEFR